MVQRMRFIRLPWLCMREKQKIRTVRSDRIQMRIAFDDRGDLRIRFIFQHFLCK